MVALQGSLFGWREPALDASAPVERFVLGDGAWVDIARGWLEGADTLLDALARDVPWRQGRRRMYDRVLDDPRLSHWYPAGTSLPHPALATVRDALGVQYGVRFGSVGCNYYRDGRDSVAPHRDRELRRLDETLVAIVTLGVRRPFLIRPLGGGKSRDFRPGAGDLLVMGGRCQAAFEHAVPKASVSGPRISVSYRWAAPETEALGAPAAPSPSARGEGLAASVTRG